MKKVLSMLLAFALVLGLMPPVAYAAESDLSTVTVTTDKTVLKAGDSITISLSNDKAIDNLSCFQFNVEFAKEAYIKTDSSVGDACKFTMVGDATSNIGPIAEKRWGLAISALDTQSNPFSLNAGFIASVTLTATENITADNAAISVYTDCLSDYDFVDLDVNLVGGNIDVTVSEETNYTVSMGDDKTVTAGETVNIPVTIGHTDETVTTYNAYDMTFGYDASKLDLNMATVESEGYSVIPGDNQVRIVRYGADTALGEALQLSFTAKSTGTSEVTVLSAKVDQAANSVEFDAPEAVLADDGKVSITVSGYTVSLPDDFTTDEEDLVVEPGEDFTFKPVDPNYDYTFSVAVGDTVTDNQTFGDNGSYTIENINGNVTVTVTEKTPKSFSVTLDEDMTGASTATYNTDYTFTLDKKDGYTYNVQMTIGGADYTGFTVTENEGTLTYTIPGSDITGAIVAKGNKTEVIPESYSVTFTGNGAGDVAEGTAASAEHGKDYTFALDKEAGYSYTVTATMGGEAVDVTEGEAGYTIQKVTGELVINIEKESSLGIDEVTVSTYVELDNKTMYLVSVAGTPEENKAFAYDGNVMYKTSAYGENVYSWLVIVDKAEAALTVEAATAMITLADASAETLAQTYDVNMTGTADVNDAQLVYDMYNGKYSDFTTVTVQKFLNADVNTDKVINAADAVAVVHNAN